MASLSGVAYRLQMEWVGRRVRAAGVVLGLDVGFHGAPIVFLIPGSRVYVGSRGQFVSRSMHTALGVNHPVVIRTLSSDAEIVIGEDFGMSGGSICARDRVQIGDGVLLGANVTIADTDFHPLHSPHRRYAKLVGDEATAAVDIRDNVFIGTGAFIGKGVIIGENSVIGAHSVVTKSVEPNSIAAGNPAKKVGIVQL